MTSKGKEPFWVISLIIGVILTNSDTVEFPYILPTNSRSGKRAFDTGSCSCLTAVDAVVGSPLSRACALPALASGAPAGAEARAGQSWAAEWASAFNHNSGFGFYIDERYALCSLSQIKWINNVGLKYRRSRFRVLTFPTGDGYKMAFPFRRLGYSVIT